MTHMEEGKEILVMTVKWWCSERSVESFFYFLFLINCRRNLFFMNYSYLKICSKYKLAVRQDILFINSTQLLVN